MTDTEPVPVPDGVIVRRGEALARHVPHRFGGPCDAFVVVQAHDAVPAALAWCRDEGLNRTWLGAGTRIAPRDGGLAGAVLRLGQGFVHVTDDGDGWWCGGATPVAWLAAVQGWDALSGWPGTLGASWAHDEGWAPWLDRVRVVRRGHEVELSPDEVGAPDRVVWLGARVRKASKAPLPSQALPGAWCAPVEDEDVAALLREAGLAGTRLRSVMLPEEAPERLVNLGGGTARDATTLLKGVIDRVHQARGVLLADRLSWWGRVS